MEPSDFYLTLPSNASMHTHPTNTLTHYITTLPKRILLRGQWECGLVEVQYPHSWYNIVDDDAGFAVTLPIDEEHPRSLHTKTVRIGTGYYKDPWSLILSINASLRRVVGEGRVKLSYNIITHKVSVHMAPNTVFRAAILTAVLGFRTTTLDYLPKDPDAPDFKVLITEANTVITMERGLDSLYIYTDVVEPRVVGDSLVPLLRIIPVSGRHGDIVSKTFDKIHYVPVLYKEFGTIEIDIRDDTGNRVPFEVGKVTVTLHFQRQRTALF